MKLPVRDWSPGPSLDPQVYFNDLAQKSSTSLQVPHAEQNQETIDTNLGGRVAGGGMRRADELFGTSEYLRGRASFELRRGRLADDEDNEPSPLTYRGRSKNCYSLVRSSVDADCLYSYSGRPTPY